MIMVAFQRLNICYSSNSSATLASSVAIPRYLPLQIVRYNHQGFCLFKISKQRSAEPATKSSVERVKKRSAFAMLAALCSVVVAVLLVHPVPALGGGTFPHSGTDSSASGSSSRLERWPGAGYTSLGPACWNRLYQPTSLLSQLVQSVPTRQAGQYACSAGTVCTSLASMSNCSLGWSVCTSLVSRLAELEQTLYQLGK
jgi:hypothetical protein